MTNRISSLHTFASRLLNDQIRDLVLPAKTNNKGCLGAVFHDRPPWLFALETGKKLDTPFVHTAVGMAFRPTAKTEVNPERNLEVAIVHGDNYSRVVFYDISLGATLESLPLPRATAVAYSHQGNRIAFGNSSGRVHLYDLQDGHRRKELFSVVVGKSAIVRIEFSGQGECVFALTASGAVYQIELRTGVATKRDLKGGLEDEDFECWAHAMHGDARICALSGSSNRKSGKCNVWILDIDKGRRFAIPTGHKVYVRRLNFVGDNQLVVIGDAGAEVYDLETRALTAVKRSGVKLEVAYSAVRLGDHLYVTGR